MKIIIACIAILASAYLSAGEGISVHVSVYSGRPNPEWTISDAEQTKLLKDKIGSLKKKVDQPEWARSGKTGYSGLYLMGKGLGDYVRIYDGVVEITKGENNVAYYQDDQEVESWLLAEAQKQKFEKGVMDKLAAYDAKRTHQAKKE